MSAGKRAREIVTECLYAEGYAARTAGKSRGTNPEPRPSYPNHRHWDEGWDAKDHELEEAEEQSALAAARERKERKVVLQFKTHREMLNWLMLADALDEVKKKYPPNEWTGHIDLFEMQVYVMRK